jgi:hypothetical protein
MESPAALQLHAKFILLIPDNATRRGDTVSSATHEASAAAPIKGNEGPANGRKVLSSISSLLDLWQTLASLGNGGTAAIRLD